MLVDGLGDSFYTITNISSLIGYIKHLTLTVHKPGSTSPDITTISSQMNGAINDGSLPEQLGL